MSEARRHDQGPEHQFSASGGDRADLTTPHMHPPQERRTARSSLWRAGNGQRRSALSIRLWQIGIALAGLLLWQILTDVGIMDPFFFSRPSNILAQIWDWFSTGYIWRHLGVTLLEALLSFALGTVLGVLFGFSLARLPTLSQVLDPYIQMFNALPRVILAPIFMLWFGLGIWSKVALGITLVFFIVFFNTYRGVREVDVVVLNNARMLGASERQLIWYVFVPSALSWIFSSLHTSIGFAIVGAVVGEYLGSSQGVGYLISQAEGLFNTAEVFSGMAILMMVVLIVDYAVNRLERRLLRWRPSQAEPFTPDISEQA